MFKPYSPEIRGDLIKYLRSHDGTGTDNLFRGPEHFFEIRDRGLMIPDFTSVRVDRSPIPDLVYVVNSEFMLESDGIGELNMSLIGAEKGIYDPNEVLKDKNWSIYYLNFSILSGNM